MEELLSRLWDDLVGRVWSPMSFRFILQPTMAILFGIKDGLRFAREGRSFLLWGGPEDPVERRAQFLATWRSIGKVFVLAMVLDVLYQLIVLHWVYPLETLIVALVLAIVPYLSVRGLVNAAMRAWRHPDNKT